MNLLLEEEIVARLNALERTALILVDVMATLAPLARAVFRDEVRNLAAKTTDPAERRVYGRMLDGLR